MAHTNISESLKTSIATLRVKVNATQTSWMDKIGINFREGFEKTFESQCNQFIKELESLEEFISQARSKAP